MSDRLRGAGGALVSELAPTERKKIGGLLLQAAKLDAGSSVFAVAYGSCPD